MRNGNILVIILITCATTFSSHAFTTEDLKKAIFTDLTNSLKNVKSDVCGKEAGRISSLPECSGAKDTNALQTSLTSAFKTAAELDWTNNSAALTGVAAKVASDLFKPPTAGPITTFDKLYDALYVALCAKLPRVATNVVAMEAGSTAQTCSSATNQNDLSAKLDSQLQQSKPLGLDTDAALREVVIGETLSTLFPSKSWRTIPILKANQNASPWQINIYTGARVDNPYTITVSNGVGQLAPGGSSTDGYIEFELNNRYVVRRAGTDDLLIPFMHGTSTIPDGVPHFFMPFDRFPDLDTRIGYTFRGTSAPTNFSVSTVAGGSDIYGDTSAGFPFAQVAGTNDSWKGQLTIEVGGGFATDKQHLDIHPDFFGGLGSQASFTAKGFGSTNYQGYWFGRAGFALIDEPSIVPGTSTVNLNSFQEPEFNLRWVPAVGTTVVYPLNTWLNVQAGFNIYFTQTPPAAWNVNLGVSVNIDQIFGSLAK